MSTPMSAPQTRLEVLHVPDCPNLPVLLERLHAVIDLPVTTRAIDTSAAAAAAGMHGSPTLLINGHDPFPTPPGWECGVSCRLYRDEHGHPVGAPSPTQLRDALASASHPPASNPIQAGAGLSAWRTRATPVAPLQKAVHQTILRTFAATGQPPEPASLDAITASSTRTTGDVLVALHGLDAIRLTPDRQIAVAYPFSAAPTRHRVRIGDHVQAFAMCAIDALGIAAMLGQDTHIHSTDPTTGNSITITTTGDHSSWQPPEAVVFLSSTAGDGPSADCCCDYLNFFSHLATAAEWTTAQPHVPGAILSARQAEQLGRRLFAPLLATY
jgi:hypothetical protein